MSRNTRLKFPEEQAEVTTRRRLPLARWITRWEVQLIILNIVAMFMGTLLSPYFLDINNLLGMTTNFIEKGLMALPMAFIIITASIDLSVASNMAMSAIAMGTLFEAGAPMWVAILFGLTVGTIGGIFNGLLVGRLKLPSLVATLGTFSLYRGLGFSLLGDQTVKGFPSWFFYLGQGYIGDTPVPFSLVLFFTLAILFGLLLHYTTFGRYVYAIGQNELACRYSGVNVDRIKVVIFAVMGFVAALAGLVIVSRFTSVRSDVGLGFELDVITIVVLGGVSIFGGSGSMVGVVLAWLLLSQVRFGMSLMNIRGQIQSVVVGTLLILAILVPNIVSQIQVSWRARRRDTAQW